MDLSSLDFNKFEDDKDNDNNSQIDNSEYYNIKIDEPSNGPRTSPSTDKDIFLIKKIKKPQKKKRGPKPTKKNIKRDRNHIRYSKDLIIRKILVHFLISSIKTMNQRIKKNNIKKKLKKLKPIFKTKKYELIYNYFMTKTFGEMLSEEISEKYKNEENKKYNEEIIKKIYEENKDNEIIELFNKKVEIIYKIYVGKTNEEKYSDFFKLEKDINNLAQKDTINDIEYYDKYGKEAKDLLDTLKKNI